jgi:predicted SAM-dependent methyltransferase
VARRRWLLYLLSHRTLALIRWDLHFLLVRIRNAVTGADRKLLARTSRAPHPRYLNLGSGPRGRDESNWVNVDGYMDHNVHHLMDFGRPFPFADGSFDGIFTEHVLEHFSREDGVAVFQECLRVLGPGGLLRVVVPDAEKVIATYREAPERLAEHRLPETGLAMEVVNMYAYQRYEHQCLYDWALMRRTLADAGFAEITCRRYLEGANPALAIDDAKYEWESLYVEGSKVSGGA